MNTTTKTGANPITEPSTLEHHAVPFDLIRPEHFMPALDLAIEHGRKALAQIKSSEPSFGNTIAALDHCTEEMEYVNLLFSNLLVADTNEELQKLSMVIGPKIASFANDILLDTDLFEKIRDVFEKRNSSHLTAEQRYLTEKVFRDFRRSGADLAPDKKERARAIDERLAQLGPKFRENTLAATNAFEMWIDTEKDLSGLPESARQAAREAAKEKGQPAKWLFTLHQPSFLPFLRFADNRELRKKIYLGYSSRCMNGPFDNRDVLQEMVALMTEKARLLGARTYAEWALETRMAETPQDVLEFLQEMLTVVKPAADRDLKAVQDFAAANGGPSLLEAWDYNYYAEKLKQKKYAFDEEQLRPYFKLENVLDGVFELAGRLFGLKFKRNERLPVYHKDVQVFEVERANGKFVGLFYTDFFPRESKSGGAWMTNYLEQGPFRGETKRPHVSIVCNFTKPMPGKPSLLTFDEVRTLFHEFGHALHSLLSNVQHRSLAGTNVYLDFVELPSQILENWALEEELLKHYAVHYQTGETLPKHLADSLKAAQKFQAGYFAIRQLNFAFLDMAWYQTPPAGKVDVEQFERQVTQQTRIFPDVPGTNWSTHFTHTFGGGYASGYYSYKWAEALDADAYEYFKEKGIFDPETARKFEEHILSKGGSDHPMRLYEKFRGRKPDPQALLRRDGLIN